MPSLPSLSRSALAAALLAVPARAHASPRVAPDTSAMARRDSTAHAAADTTAAPTPAPPRARLGDHLTVHGYFTQGVAGLAGHVQFYGIDDRTSGDFRYAAIQARYAFDAKNQLLVQLNHRDLGRSPITDFESAVNVNWAFAQHTFRDGTELRVGRVPIPRGIYNELRSVGVSLPMYRPPVVFYDEGAYYSETITGGVLSHTFLAERPWTLDAHVYAGGWKTLYYDTWSEAYSVYRVHARHALGAQLWLNTPIDGVRLGAAGTRYVTDEDPTATTHMHEMHVSLDATRERGFVRAEVETQAYLSDDFLSSYAQIGARLVGHLSGVVEIQRSRDRNVTYGVGLPSAYDWHRSNGAGLSYAVTPSLVVKLEHHRDRGIQIEQPGDPRDPPRFRYTIASVSLSF